MAETTASTDSSWSTAETVIAVAADPYHRAAVAYGRDESVLMAELFVTEVLMPISSRIGFDRRSDLEWLITLPPDGPGHEEFVSASRTRLGAHLVEIHGQVTFLDLCMGIAVGTQLEGVSSHEDLVRCADAALSFALFQQHNVVVATVDAMKIVRDEVGVANRLAIADEHDFHLHYQPIVTLPDLRPVGFESLLRWHTESDVLAPAVFLAAAEATSLIVPIGRRAIGDAIRTLATDIWPTCGEDAFVSVNLSGQQLWDDGIVEHIGGLIRANDVDPQRVWVEVREDEAIRLGTAAAQAIHELHEIGCTICVDDLGAGYSALRYVRDLPVDVLKVDRTLITGLVTNPSDRAVVQAICDMPRATGMTTLAEGVESEEVLAELGGLGFDMAQGYLFGKPEPAATQFGD